MDYYACIGANGFECADYMSGQSSFLLSAGLIQAVLCITLLFIGSYGSRPKTQIETTATSQLSLAKRCRYCGRSKSPTDIFCPVCGKTQE
jgi:hypothetical protein